MIRLYPDGTEPLRVMFNQISCGSNDFREGAVVNIHMNFMGVGKILFNVKHDVRIGASETIDGK